LSYSAASEDQMQRHLNEARAANRVLNEALAAGSLAVAEWPNAIHCRHRAVPLTAVVTILLHASDGLEIRAEAGIQIEVVDGSVEAWVVEEIEELSVVTEREAFAQLKILEQVEIEARLERAAEDVAANAGITRFRVVAGGPSAGRGSAGWHAFGSRRVDENAERPAVQNRIPRIHARRSLQLNGFQGAARDGQRWVGNEIVAGAPILAATSPE